MELTAAALGLACALAAGAQASAAAQAPAGAAPAQTPRTLVYLTPDEVDARRLLAPPAPEGSPRAAAAELRTLHEVMASASPERAARAKWDDDHEDPSLFMPTLGAGFDMKALPATAALLAVVQADSEYAAGAAKKTFPKKRPWAVDASVKTCDPDDKPMTSYPSGHATLGYSLAMTLAVVMPDRAQTLLARAADYAYSREVCGSHFAADSQASQALAAAMVTALLSKPAFQAKVEAARRELATTSPAR